MKNHIFSPILLIIMTTLTASAPVIAGEDLIFEKTVSTTTGQLLKVNSFAGGIKVTTSSASEVTVKVYGKEDTKDNIDVTAEGSSTGVDVNLNKKSGSRKNNWNLRMEIVVPADYNVNLKTGGGNLSVFSIKGKAELSTSGGNVSIEDISGETVISTMGGNINLSGFNGNVNAETSGGNVKMSGTNGVVAASTMGGNITLTYTGKNYGIALSTMAGNIKLDIPNEFDADVDLSTTCGRITGDLTGVNEKHTGSNLKSTIGSGGSELKCTTMAGTITVNKK